MWTNISPSGAPRRSSWRSWPVAGTTTILMLCYSDSTLRGMFWTLACSRGADKITFKHVLTVGECAANKLFPLLAVIVVATVVRTLYIYIYIYIIGGNVCNYGLQWGSDYNFTNYHFRKIKPWLLCHNKKIHCQRAENQCCSFVFCEIRSICLKL